MVPSSFMAPGARVPLRPLLCAVLCVAVLGACAGTGDDPVRRALEVVPASALERTVLVTVGDPVDGFGTVLPSGALPQLLGMETDGLRAVAETGGAPFTVILGDVDADEAVAAAGEHDYVAREIGAWWALRPADGAASPLAAAIPAVAVREGVAVLGSAAEVGAVVDGAPGAASLDWVSRLLEAVGDDDRAVAFGLPEQIADAVAASDEQLPELPPESPQLRAYEGYALVWSDGAEGRILLARPPGDATTDDAAALAMRTSTDVVLGGRRHAADIVEGGGPRVDAEAGVIALPVSWLVRPAELREDITQGRLVFLAPR